MKQTLDDGRVLFFGQQLADVEALFSCNAIDDPLRVARKGIDKLLRVNGLTLRFDQGRLKQMEFKEPYQLKNPLTPYPESWKNFDVIGEERIRNGMPRDEFLAYLHEWDRLAASHGAKKVEFGDMTEGQYAIGTHRSEFYDAVHVSMGPTRRAGGGGIWCDGWNISFKKVTEPLPAGSRDPIVLESISAFRDEFNSVARRIDPRSN
jgi:hypothetical protein